jgi:CYTH domain-containing protein
MPHGFEIERKYLLDAMPEVPDGAQRWSIEQGYLSPATPAPRTRGDDVRTADSQFDYGRLRRTVVANTSVVCTHTVKVGSGVKRFEHERTITQEEFDRHWPRTLGRRLAKTRWRVQHGAVIWEIDDIHNDPLVLAEVELETPDQPVTPPQWLAAHIVREVTDDPAYTNSAIAERVGRGEKASARVGA